MVLMENGQKDLVKHSVQHRHNVEEFVLLRGTEVCIWRGRRE